MPPNTHDTSKDEPLRNDIRLLGRVLGDTVREQEGAAVFDIVERVRQTAVRFARDGDPTARAELASLLDPLPGDAFAALAAHDATEAARILREISRYNLRAQP